MRISLRYFDACPNWEIALDRIGEALESMDQRAEINLEEVTAADAQRLRFVGSPTILIDGIDPFQTEDASFGLSCRVYPTERGLEGSPSVAQLACVIGPRTTL